MAGLEGGRGFEGYGMQDLPGRNRLGSVEPSADGDDCIS